jgi:hypothetical protein
MCVIITHMGFGKHIRKLRQSLQAKDKSYSVRKLAARLDIAPNYLSKIELEQVSPPSEKVVLAWPWRRNWARTRMSCSQWQEEYLRGSRELS